MEGIVGRVGRRQGAAPEVEPGQHRDLFDKGDRIVALEIGLGARAVADRHPGRPGRQPAGQGQRPVGGRGGNASRAEATLVRDQGRGQPRGRGAVQFAGLAVGLKRVEPALGFRHRLQQLGDQGRIGRPAFRPRQLQPPFRRMHQHAELAQIEQGSRSLERVEGPQRSRQRRAGFAGLQRQQGLPGLLGEVAAFADKLRQEGVAHEASGRW